MDALVSRRGNVAMIIVEHHVETVLPIVDRAYLLVNGQVAYEGTAHDLERDTATRQRLLGLVEFEERGSTPRSPARWRRPRDPHQSARPFGIYPFAPVMKEGLHGR